jgi:hypothetical protein
MIFFNLLCSLLHFLLCYIVFIISIISNDIKVLTFLLLLMIYIKILFSMYERCILTILEENEKYSETVTLFIKTLTNYPIPIKEREIIIINIALLLLMNKIFALLVIRNSNFNFNIKNLSI